MSADDQGYLRVWDIVAGGCVASFKSPHGAIHGLDLIKPTAATAAPSAAGAGAGAGAGASAATVASTESAGVPLFGTVIGANFADCSVGLFQIPGPMLIPHAALPRTLLTRTMVLQRGSSSALSGTVSMAGAALTRGASVGSSILSAFRTEQAAGDRATAAAAAGAGAGAAGTRSGSLSAVSGDEEELDAVLAAGEDLASHSALVAPVPAPRRKGVGAPPGCKVTSASEADVVFAFEEAPPSATAADGAAPVPDAAPASSGSAAAAVATRSNSSGAAAATASSSTAAADSSPSRPRLRGSFASLSVSSARSAEALALELERLTAGVCERDALLVDQLCAALQIAYCDLQAARAVAAEEKAELMQRLLKAERANIEIAALAMRGSSFSERDRDRAPSVSAGSVPVPAVTSAGSSASSPLAAPTAAVSSSATTTSALVAPTC